MTPLDGFVRKNGLAVLGLRNVAMETDITQHVSRLGRHLGFFATIYMLETKVTKIEWKIEKQDEVVKNYKLSFRIRYAQVIKGLRYPI